MAGSRVKRTSVERPPRPEYARPAKQERSRKTLDRLLEALEQVLEAGGLEAATVPAIARRAGLSVGVVYRRFPDKDALLRAYYERFFSRVLENNRRGLDPERWKGASLSHIVRAGVWGMTEGYRLKRNLLRALFLYSRTHADPEFRRHADALNAETMRLLETLMLERREEIGHPRPEMAARFGLIAVAFFLHGTLLIEEGRYEKLLPPNVQVADELARLYLGYLEVEEGPIPPVKRPRARRT